MRCPRPGFAIVTLSLAALLGGCSGQPTEPSDALTFTFDFHRGPQGFTAGFADYPPAHAEIYELTSGYRALPPPLESRSALFISGVNRSDDLFMFFKGPIGDLRMNIDVGNQSRGGAHAVVLGNIANSRSCEQRRQWERKSFQSLTAPEPISVPPDGRVWLLFGADSGFESRTAIYFTLASVTFTPL